MSTDPNEPIDSVYDFSAVALDRKRVITSGGFADVHVVSHPQFGPLALKRPRAQCAPGSQEFRHLEKEAAIWRNLHHPNVLQFLGIHRDSEAIYLVSPFLPNGTVMDYISAHPSSGRAGFILDLAMGLEYLHRCGIVHGDIKGRNLLVSSSINCVVADFGLAKAVDTQTVTSQRGQGTVRWESPEMLEGGPRTFKSDVYAFGITIITGKVPFDGVSTNAVMRKVLKKERPIPKPRVSSTKEWHTKEWAVAEAAWAHDPESRPSMDRNLTVLRGPRKGPECRIQVLCDKFPQHEGYVSRRMDGPTGSHVVTRSVEDGLVVTWDPAAQGPKLLETINNVQRDLRWATFTSASGTRGNFQVLPTVHSPGQEAILTWSWSDSGNLTAHALGDTVEAAINVEHNPPHLFFCPKMDHWGQIAFRAAIRFVLEELGPED
ncbi:hypothetical protein FRC00_005212 [Tulasnella sp. 408]|nr:hypothetical protein FRC00_005212 [Tulasnella sp. 408]